MVYLDDTKGLGPAGAGDSEAPNEQTDLKRAGKTAGSVRMPPNEDARIFAGAGSPEMFGDVPSELDLQHAIEVFANFLQQERANYYPLGQPLDPKSKTFLGRFFDPALLGQVKILELAEGRISNPDFYKRAAEKGVRNLPDLKHQTTVTFLDVVVFNEKIHERALFHGLVHATQVQVLGIERFSNLFVRGFLRSKSYFMTPMKAHAFTLDCQFAGNRERGFSVETEVVRWAEEGRY
jgi:hypothetical protein